MIVRELITKLGFNYDPSPMKKADSAVDGLKKGILSLKGGLAALGAVISTAAITHFFTSAADYAEDILKVSQKTGLGVESVQRLGYAAYLADIDIGSLQMSLGFLSRNLVAAKEGSKEAGEAFQKALGKGVNLKGFKNNEELLLALSKRFQEMPDGAEKAALAMKLFGKSGQAMIPFLNQGPDAIKRAGDELEAFGGVLGVDALEAGNSFNDNLKRMYTFFLTMRNVIAARLFPVINKAIDTFIEWLKVNKEIIRLRLEQFFQLIGSALKFIGEGVKLLIKGYEKLSEAIGGANAAIVALAAAAVIALGPAGAAVAAIIAAIFLLVDDVQAYLRGEPSFFEPIYIWIEELVKRIEEGIKQATVYLQDLKTVIDHDIVPILRVLGKVGKEVWDSQVQPILDVLKFLKEMAEIIDNLKMKVLDLLGLGDIYKQFSTGVDNAVNKSLKEAVIGALPGGGLFNFVNNTSDFIHSRADTIRGGQPQGPNQQTNSFKVDQKVEVNVQSTADPNEIAQQITNQSMDGLNNIFSQMADDLDPGAEN